MISLLKIRKLLRRFSKPDKHGELTEFDKRLLKGFYVKREKELVKRSLSELTRTRTLTLTDEELGSDSEEGDEVGEDAKF